MTLRMTQTLGFVACLGIFAAGCSDDAAPNEAVNVDFRASVEVDFHALQGDTPAATRRGDIVFDLRKSSDYEDYADQIRCVGLDPFDSSLKIAPLSASSTS